jgi:hypothetical protein
MTPCITSICVFFKQLNRKETKMKNINLQAIGVLYSPKQNVFHTETLRQTIRTNTRTFVQNKKGNDYILLRIVNTEEEASAVIDELKVLWGECNSKPRFKTKIERWIEKQLNS